MSGRPRMVILDMAPVGLTPPVTPGRRPSSSPRLWTGWRSISSRVMTLTDAGASRTSTPVAEAVTTTSETVVAWGSSTGLAARAGEVASRVEVIRPSPMRRLVRSICAPEGVR
ncbi:hypothetical protein D3C80_1597230 [compost metagenome]